ncbi:MAG: DUF2334 domain-containing protein [Sphingomicrobium sp.]
MTARYIMRMDDACPTIDSARWARFEALFDELGIKPIVAVVPDNQDSDLEFGDSDPDFWDRARAWQAKGWTIGLHGFRHILPPFHGKQYLPFHPRSEFAGFSLDDQADKIRSGWAALRDHGLTPTMWVAPAHSFDRVTLEAVERETPIRMVSDGIARNQFFADGFYWLPQQLWSLTPKRSGLWTVCLHPNSMADDDFARFAAQLRGPYRGNVIAVDAVELVRRPRSPGDRVEALGFWWRHYVMRARERIKKLVVG